MLSRAATALPKRNAIISYELIIIIVTSSTSGNTGRAVPRARADQLFRVGKKRTGTITLDETLRGHHLPLLSFIFHLQRMHTSMKKGSAHVPVYVSSSTLHCHVFLFLLAIRIPSWARVAQESRDRGTIDCARDEGRN